MSLLVIGLNHTTAAIEMRERVAFSPEQIPEALLRALDGTGLAEAVILSTCNRTELIAATPAGGDGEECALDWFSTVHHLSRAQLDGSLYRHRDAEAMRHLIRVASGLDSMVMGEPQIFGQLKSAYSAARHAGTVGAELSRAVSHVFAVAKKVRTETAIGENPVSVAFAAVKLARHIFSDLAATTALLIGAGETIELVARHLSEAGVPRLIVANRTLHRAEQIATRFAGEAILLAEIPDNLVRADIVISSTASQLPILGKGTVEQAMRARRHKPIFMVDIAVPRDIESQVAEIDDVYLYSIDDLQQIIDDNRRARATEAERAGTIIDAGVQAFLDSSRSLDAVSALRDYRERAERLRDQELERAQRQLRGGAAADQVLEQLARGLTNKLLHGPSVELRRAAAEGRTELLDWSRRLLGLEHGAAPGDEDP
ncbi:MAG: glutamyl-tRNA reductase [Gammaproteobacteria bacterium]|jgi:glutamyl-tRNA reductase|nr:glutamyl-tRNA reductase [Gammaproteobacteria bacterium]MBP6051742.1 glutamyl-tRNA reductase [Pseudomonadales bacterium]MBK6584751.1 glutamyl-tRNA reductase [Gammaproteobacteria bacterium]MBK7171086.1 glutamyl-tRNA reductase [Gammaproteobacteria bacterium]MBK7519740.1 glutamyl-tRNA reductase [Gammaproteobacteria bacterium]